MNQKTLTLLNTSIISTHGTFKYAPLSLDEARALVAEFQQTGKSIQSSIGHQSTAELLAALLNYPVTVNRMDFRQTVDDAAIVFKLKGRPQEGRILTRPELEEIGYEFGLLTRIE